VNNLFESATPEQKLSILTNELLTPIEVIRGFAAITKKEIESNNIDPARILNDINRIAEAADKIKKLRDDLLRSK
jgi:signal transduction histidine kinase